MCFLSWLARSIASTAPALALCAAPAAGSTAQQAYFKASNTAASDHFANAVAISGDTLVVGAPSEDSNATGVNGNESNNSAPGAGAAYVFVRTGTTWTQQAYLKASNTNSGDNFGAAVAIDGDTIIVGANGEDSSATGVDGNQLSNSVGFSGAAASESFSRVGGSRRTRAA
ncbi:MAG: FG-GAP repeat protein [Planctomycetota bacterium]|nr:FG-GAP repeat protein [Planctomycetota bacterium]